MYYIHRIYVDDVHMYYTDFATLHMKSILTYAYAAHWGQCYIKWLPKSRNRTRAFLLNKLIIGTSSYFCADSATKKNVGVCGYFPAAAVYLHHHYYCSLWLWLL
jgi:hypothetical protein